MLDRRLRIASFVLVAIGLACAIYLTYLKYAHVQCVAGEGCDIVQRSQWSELFGVSVSILGIVGYVGILIVLLLPARNELARLALVVVTGVGFLFSMYLMYRAYVTIDAFCPFCTTSAAVMTLLAIISTTRFIRGPDRESPETPDALQSPA